MGAKRRLNGVNQWRRKKREKPFMSKIFQIWDRFFSLLFHKDSENLKSLSIGLWEVGTKDRQKEWETSIPKKSCAVKKIRPKTILFFCAAILHSSLVKVFKSETTSFHYFSSRIPITKNFEGRCFENIGELFFGLLYLQWSHYWYQKVTFRPLPVSIPKSKFSLT